MRQKVNLLLAIVVLVGASGCSSLMESTRKMISDGESKQSIKRVQKKSKWVSQTQYDDLLAKYKNVSEKYDKLKETKVNDNRGFSQSDEMAKELSVNSSTDTVDVFGKNGIAREVENTLNSISSSTVDVGRELKTYKKAVALRDNGKSDESLKIFQFLERSNNKQIKVRSRIQIGQIYLEKKQFDLALQVFEKVITENAFSGKVLVALSGAVDSCAGLDLTDKKLRYQSMLTDFFSYKS
jgi:tetratricopeptide (TPR) repeat protein